MLGEGLRTRRPASPVSPRAGREGRTFPPAFASVRTAFLVCVLICLLIPSASEPRAQSIPDPAEPVAETPTRVVPIAGEAEVGTVEDPTDEAAPVPAEYEGEESDQEDISSAVLDASGKPIEEITVRGTSTAGARDFETATSITSFSVEDIQALGADDVADLAAYTPNLEISSANPTAPNFFIRGVGLSDFAANSSGAVAIFYDEVAINAPALQLATLFDVEAVNVLRGPQGSGPSRNASAGAIKIYSRRPNGEYSAHGKLSYGNYDFIDAEGAVEAPVFKDLLSARFAFRVSQREGLGKNRCGGGPPLADRVIATESSANARRVGPAAVCSEYIFRGEKSPIEPDLPTKVNDLGNWAARGTLRFQPDLWGMDWTFNLHGSQRDQLAPLGQHIGTLGDVTLPDGTKQRGVFGGRNAADYREPDIAKAANARRRELVDQGVPGAEARQRADLELAPVLARNLDAQPRVGDYNRVGRVKNDTFGVLLRGDMVLLDKIDFTTITGFESFDRLNDQDIDNSPDPLFEVLQKDEGWQFSQDVRFSGEYAGDLEWQTGAYFLTDEIRVNNKSFSGASTSNYGNPRRIYTQTLLNFASYVGFEWEIWDDLSLDGGVRLNWEEKSMDYILFEVGPPKKSDSTLRWIAPTGSIRLTYELDESARAFLKFGRGWKGGHFNAASNTSRAEIQFADPEELDAWEAGFKGSWLDHKLGVEASFFYYRYQNYQVFTFVQGFNVPPELIVINANDAENYGAEVDLTVRPVDELFMLFRLGWLESTYLDFTQENAVQVTSIVDGLPTKTNFPILIDNSGNRLLNSPQLQVTLMASYDLDMGKWGTLTPRYDASWKSETFFDPTEGRGPPNAAAGDLILPPGTLAQEPYWLHNVRLEYGTADEKVRIAGWVRNVEDKLYKVGAFNAEGFGNFTVFFVGEPRTYGFDVSVEF